MGSDDGIAAARSRHGRVSAHTDGGGPAARAVAVSDFCWLDRGKAEQKRKAREPLPRLQRAFVRTGANFWIRLLLRTSPVKTFPCVSMPTAFGKNSWPASRPWPPR